MARKNTDNEGFDGDGFDEGIELDPSDDVSDEFASHEFVDELPVKPPKAKRRTVYDRLAVKLQENPGRWIKLERKSNVVATATAGNIRRGRIEALAVGFQAEARGNELFIRYVGEDASDDALTA